MAVTIKDIARQTGLSNQAVSFALRGLPGVGEETRQRVLSVAAELGYRPNASARAFRSGKQGNIGLLLSADLARSHLPAPLFRGIEGPLADRGLRLTVGRLPDEQWLQAGRLPALLSQWAADGLLVNYQEAIPARVAEMIRNDDVPAVWINSKQETSCVYADDFDAGRRATEKLLALGHRRIAYVDYSHGTEHLPDAHYSATDREAGYIAAMRLAGLPAKVLRGEHRVLGEERVAFANRVLSASDAPTAIVCYSQSSAIPIAVAARERGLRLGVELSLISMDESPIETVGPTVSTMIVPQEQMGREAVGLLLGRITNDGIQSVGQVIAVPFAWIQGQTVAPPLRK